MDLKKHGKSKLILYTKLIKVDTQGATNQDFWFRLTLSLLLEKIQKFQTEIKTKKIIREDKVKEWQRTWNRTAHKRSLSFIPHKDHLWANQINIDTTYTRMMLGSKLNEHIWWHMMNLEIVIVIMFACKTIDHFLMEVPLYEDKR